MIVEILVAVVGVYVVHKLYNTLMKLKNKINSNVDTKNERLKLVTVASKLPFFGNLIDLLPQYFISSMFSYFSKYYGYNLCFNCLGTKVYLITRYDDIHEVLMKRPRYFNRSSKINYFNETLNFKTGLFASNGNIWSYMRRFISPSFNNSNIQHHITDLWKIACDWSTSLQKKGEAVSSSDSATGKRKIQMTKESMFFTLQVINQVAFGKEINQKFSSTLYHLSFLEDIQAIMIFGIESTLFPFPTKLFPYFPYYSTIYNKAVNANRRFENLCHHIIFDRKEKMKAADSSSSPCSSSSSSAPEEDRSIIDSLLARKETLNPETLAEFNYDAAIVENIKTLYLAGTETSSTTISWMIYNLCLEENASYLHEMRKEAKQFKEKYGNSLPELDNNNKIDEIFHNELQAFYYFWKETLRMFSPAIFLIFDVEKPYRFSSYEDKQQSNNDTKQYNYESTSFIINPKDDVLVYLEGLLKDETVFDEPLRFNPNRWNPKNHPGNPEKLTKMESYFLSFGYGPRICPGMYLSMIETIFAVLTFIDYYDFELSCPRTEVKRLLGTSVYPNQLPLSILPRNHSQL
jgi:cytochrome P450